MIQAGITTPTAGTIVNSRFTVTGFVFDDGNTGSFPGDIRFTIVNTFIKFGSGDPAVLVTTTADGWTATIDLPPGIGPGQSATLHFTCNGIATSQDNPGENSTFEVTDSRVVVAEQSPPQVVIDAFPGDRTVDVLPFRLPVLSGRALDPSGVTQVQYTIDNGPRQNVDLVAGDPAQRTWSKANIDFDFGQHTITVFATDKIGNEGSASASLIIRVTDPDDGPPPVPVDLRFTPTFEHHDWIDNLSRIVANGPDGFNVRFDAIDADLHQAAAVVSQINTALHQTTGSGSPQRLTPGLDLVPLVLPGTGGWTYDLTGAAHPDAGSGGGTAVMDLSLPEQIKLVSFRATGLYPNSHDILIGFYRSPLTDASVSDTLAEITQSTPGMTNPYDLTVPVNAAFAAVDPGKYRYFIIARAGFVADPSTISLSTVQLSYTAS